MSDGMLKKIYPGSASLLQDVGSNLVLHKTVERIHVGTRYCDVPQGILLIRGENIILIGELNDINVDEKLERVTEQEIYSLRAELIATKKSISKMRAQLYAERGLSLHDIGELCFDDG